MGRQIPFRGYIGAYIYICIFIYTNDTKYETIESEKIGMTPASEKISMPRHKDDKFDWLDEQMRKDFGKWYTTAHRKTNERMRTMRFFV